MKCALVTGGSRGIGKAICLQLSQDHGLHILINYAGNKEAAQETLAQIEKNGGSGEIIQFDVSDSENVKEKLSHWESNHPDHIIEVIVNNAGITKDNLFVFMNDEDWKRVVDVSLGGFYNVTRYLIQKMLRKRYGRIINIVSLSGLKGNPGQTNYSAAKAAVIGATKALGQEVAKRNITVNAVAPGFISTDMTEQLNEDELKQWVPMKRFGNPQEVADLVSFLASKKAGYITGEVININGGLYS